MRHAYIFLYSFLFLIPQVCSVYAQQMSEEIDRSGVAVRLLRDNGRLECVDEVKSFERLLAISADQVGFGIFGDNSGAKSSGGLIEISVDSFLGDDRMRSTLIVAPKGVGCDLFGQRASIFNASCKAVLAKTPRFNNLSYRLDGAGAMIVRDASSVNRGFMMGNGDTCLFIEPINRASPSSSASVPALDSDSCSEVVKEFKDSVISKGIEYPLLSRSNKARSGVITQKGKNGLEIIFYASSANPRGQCEIAANKIQLFSNECGLVRESLPELKALNIKARSKGESILLDAGGDLEIEMSDIAPKSCLMSISKVRYK